VLKIWWRLGTWKCWGHLSSQRFFGSLRRVDDVLGIFLELPVKFSTACLHFCLDRCHNSFFYQVHLDFCGRSWLALFTSFSMFFIEQLSEAFWCVWLFRFLRLLMFLGSRRSIKLSDSLIARLSNSHDIGSAVELIIFDNKLWRHLDWWRDFFLDLCLILNLDIVLLLSIFMWGYNWWLFNLNFNFLLSSVWRGYMLAVSWTRHGWWLRTLATRIISVLWNHRWLNSEDACIPIVIQRISSELPVLFSVILGHEKVWCLKLDSKLLWRWQRFWNLSPGLNNALQIEKHQLVFFSLSSMQL